nr:immunoglobulin heavy chain junction region [Macaca mulatta]MOX91836.1 immunoglobulin heavy chain junction region [Macaca mulatta]MOX91890.1 immunoglobulin heavy chain junction region [Macaca mulatta]MOX92225.1 immunoglobulin heavy chain junction region [Macaca mulatta]MOX93882.1 immunoglobulin heavy chain junction region [Macaca mulatta]
CVRVRFYYDSGDYTGPPDYW